MPALKKNRDTQNILPPTTPKPPANNILTFDAEQKKGLTPLATSNKPAAPANFLAFGLPPQTSAPQAINTTNEISPASPKTDTKTKIKSPSTPSLPNPEIKSRLANTKYRLTQFRQKSLHQIKALQVDFSEKLNVHLENSENQKKYQAIKQNILHISGLSLPVYGLGKLNDAIQARYFNKKIKQNCDHSGHNHDGVVVIDIDEVPHAVAIAKGGNGSENLAATLGLAFAILPFAYLAAKSGMELLEESIDALNHLKDDLEKQKAAIAIIEAGLANIQAGIEDAKTNNDVERVNELSQNLHTFKAQYLAIKQQQTRLFTRKKQAKTDKRFGLGAAIAGNGLAIKTFIDVATKIAEKATAGTLAAASGLGASVAILAPIAAGAASYMGWQAVKKNYFDLKHDKLSYKKAQHTFSETLNSNYPAELSNKADEQVIKAYKKFIFSKCRNNIDFRKKYGFFIGLFTASSAVSTVLLSVKAGLIIAGLAGAGAASVFSGGTIPLAVIGALGAVGALSFLWGHAKQHKMQKRKEDMQDTNEFKLTEFIHYLNQTKSTDNSTEYNELCLNLARSSQLIDAHQLQAYAGLMAGHDDLVILTQKNKPNKNQTKQWCEDKEDIRQSLLEKNINLNENNNENNYSLNNHSLKYQILQHPLSLAQEAKKTAQSLQKGLIQRVIKPVVYTLTHLKDYKNYKDWKANKNNDFLENKEKYINSHKYQLIEACVENYKNSKNATNSHKNLGYANILHENLREYLKQQQIYIQFKQQRVLYLKELLKTVDKKQTPELFQQIQKMIDISKVTGMNRDLAIENFDVLNDQEIAEMFAKYKGLNYNNINNNNNNDDLIRSIYKYLIIEHKAAYKQVRIATQVKLMA